MHGNRLGNEPYAKCVKCLVLITRRMANQGWFYQKCTQLVEPSQQSGLLTSAKLLLDFKTGLIREVCHDICPRVVRHEGRG